MKGNERLIKRKYMEEFIDIEDTKVKKSLTELNYIINNMRISFQEKIPMELRNAIKENMDDDYILDIDIEKKYTEQNFMPETKALLSLLISEYIGNEDCRRKWNEFDKEYLKILQKSMDFKRNTSIKENNETNLNFKKNNINLNEKTYNEIKSDKNNLAKFKEPFLKTIFRRIKSFFKKKN